MDKTAEDTVDTTAEGTVELQHSDTYVTQLVSKQRTLDQAEKRLALRSELD
jgi:hypothetical protein